MTIILVVFELSLYTNDPSVHNECHKHYRIRALLTGTVFLTLERYFSKLGTYSSHSRFRNIPLFKTALKKKPSRKDEDKMHRRILPVLLFSYFPI